MGVWDLTARDRPVALLDLGDQGEQPVVTAEGTPSGPRVAVSCARRSCHRVGRFGRWRLRTSTLGVIDSPFALSPDGSTLAVAAGAQLAFVETATGAVRSVVPVAGGVDRISFSADGSKVASSGDTLMVWDISGTEPVELLVQDDGGGWPAFDASGRTLHTAAFDGMLLAWDLSGERGFLPSVGGETTVEGLVKYSPDGRRVLRARGGPDPRFVIQDVASGLESPAVDVLQDFTELARRCVEPGRLARDGPDRRRRGGRVGQHHVRRGGASRAPRG